MSVCNTMYTSETHTHTYLFTCKTTNLLSDVVNIFPSCEDDPLNVIGARKNCTHTYLDLASTFEVTFLVLCMLFRWVNLTICFIILIKVLKPLSGGNKSNKIYKH